MLKGKKILLGISGSIAAYKTPQLVRLLVKKGAEVKVVMSPAARDFVTPLVLSTVSKNPVAFEYIQQSTATWNNHVDLGLWGDVLLLAPASANTLAKMVNGQSDNILLATYMSARCPVFFAPAMDVDMYLHPGTQKNIEILKAYGHHLIPPGIGELASGLSGEGRMEEPENIVTALERFFASGNRFAGKKILVTAGPTYEPIDPVRFIGNHSSGKMGVEIADTLAAQGAEVTLVIGPSSVKNREKSVIRIPVQSAEEMYQACISRFPEMDSAILAAAVADYRPKTAFDSKIKKLTEEYTLELVKNPDILASLGKIKKENQILVGFALETNNEIEYATGKLEKKNLDFIVMNSLKDEGAGFQKDTNKITIIGRNNNIRNFQLKPKSEVAADIVDTLADYLHIAHT